MVLVFTQTFDRSNSLHHVPTRNIHSEDHSVKGLEIEFPFLCPQPKVTVFVDWSHKPYLFLVLPID